MSEKFASQPVSVTFGDVGNKVRLEVAQRVGAHLIRVVIVVDPSYASQSFAYAEVLNGALQWTQLVSTPASVWHDKVAWVKDEKGAHRITDETSPTKALHELELELFVKAAAILDV